MSHHDKKYILVTGGAGYIGSHTVVELLEQNYSVVVVDNLSNSCEEALKRAERLTQQSIPLVVADVTDAQAIRKVFQTYPIDAVIHFAGLKAVGESTEKPLAYYKNNILSSLVLLEEMNYAGCRNFVFSSSATVYGEPATVPILEGFPRGATNPYGRTKHFIEHILEDYCTAMNRGCSSPQETQFNAISLRYFNPVGAHPSGLMGEDPQGIPNNLMPYLAQVACGIRTHLNVFGNDYDTPDGTGIRDYIHVVDLAKGHVAALNKLKDNPGWVTYNLGTGRGHTVLDMVQAMSKAVGRELPYKIVGRRPGDVTNLTSDPSLANRELQWKANYTLDQMCADLWNWQSRNPNGYRK